VDFRAAKYDLCRYLGDVTSRIFGVPDGGCDRDGPTFQNIESQSKSVGAFCGSSSVYFMGRNTLSDAIAWRYYTSFLRVFCDRGSRHDASYALFCLEMAKTKLDEL
jgi:hypothetical protein